MEAAAFVVTILSLKCLQIVSKRPWPIMPLTLCLIYKILHHNLAKNDGSYIGKEQRKLTVNMFTCTACHKKTQSLNITSLHKQVLVDFSNALKISTWIISVLSFYYNCKSDNIIFTLERKEKKANNVGDCILEGINCFMQWELYEHCQLN